MNLGANSMRPSPHAHPMVRLLATVAVERGMRTKQIAATAGVGYYAVRAWVQGRRHPSIAGMQALAGALGYELKLVRK